jgi:hypothetical protein
LELYWLTEGQRLLADECQTLLVMDLGDTNSFYQRNKVDQGFAGRSQRLLSRVSCSPAVLFCKAEHTDYVNIFSGAQMSSAEKRESFVRLDGSYSSLIEKDRISDGECQSNFGPLLWVDVDGKKRVYLS